MSVEVIRKKMQQILGDVDGCTEKAMTDLARQLMREVERIWNENIEADRFLSDEARGALCYWWDDKFDVESGEWQKLSVQHTDVELVRRVCDTLCEAEHPEEYEEYRRILANDRALAEYVKYRPIALEEWRRARERVEERLRAAKNRRSSSSD